MLDQLRRIPEELRALNQFVVWRYEDATSGKPTKVPYSAKTGEHASVTNAHTWSSFDEACNALVSSKGLLAGIGFVFSRDDEFAGIDLDQAKDAETVARQLKVYESFNSYSERSPSGQGLHIIIKANLLSGRRRSSIELYSSERFFTMTGDVFNDAPIVERQALASVLWEEMGRVKTSQGYKPQYEESDTDEAIIKRAIAAVNGDKFKKLLEGTWPDLYASQSEADMAFIDIVAFYTQSRNQITRIFRNSVLGQREKAQRADYVEYMLNKAFDRMLPPIDIEGLANGLDEAIARKCLTRDSALDGIEAARDAANAPIEALAASTPSEQEPSPYTMPPGLLGEVAAFMYEAAPRQVPEIALAAAIALMAGVCGRAYNISDDGLNLYVLLLAETGLGKEGMAIGIDKLFNAIKNEVPAAKEFRGPSEIASAPALFKHMSKGPKGFLSQVGEFGLKMQQLSSQRASPVELGLKRCLLDLYHKSGVNRTVQPWIYSDKDKDTLEIVAPSLTILGESTFSEFYKAIDETMIASGLLPRFLIIECNSLRPHLNEGHKQAKLPDSVKSRFADLAAHCLKMGNGVNGQPIAVDVETTSEANDYLRKFGNDMDDKINASTNNTIREIWNRAHIKALRLASLVAVGCNPYNPIIDMVAAEWAVRLVCYDCSRINKRFDDGNFGAENAETKQADEVRRIMRQYVSGSFSDVSIYSHNQQLHKAKVIPHAYILRRLAATSAFRTDRIGATNAIKRAVQNAIDSGYVAEIGKMQMQNDYETSQKAYVIVDSIWAMRE
jgi:hypothetical protein